MPLPTTGLVLDLDVDQVTGVDGDPISTVVDQSSTGANATSSGTNRPTLRTGAINGKKAAEFDGTNDWIGGSLGSWGQNDFTIYQIFMPTAWSGGDDTYYGNSRDLFNTEVAGIANDYGTAIGSSGHFVAGIGNNGGSDHFVVGGSMSLSTWHVGTMRRDKTAPRVDAYIDGTSVGTPLGAGTNIDPLNSSSTYTIGAANPRSGSFFQGRLTRVIVYNVAHDATQRAAVHTYIQDTYGITVSDYTSTTALNTATLQSENSLTATLAGSATSLNAATLSSEQSLAATLSVDTLLAAGVLQSEMALSATLSRLQPLATWTGDDDLRFDSAFELSAWLFLEPTEVDPPVGTHVADFDVVHVALPNPTLVNGVPVGWTPTSVSRSKWGRYQVVIDGTDVSHYRDKRTRVLSYASNDPFGDADASLSFPQITEFDDLTTVPWWRKGAEVTIRRRHPDGTKTIVWEGILASEEPSRTAHCLGLLYQLDLYIQPRLFRDDPVDVGFRIAHAINHRAKHHGFRGAYCVNVETTFNTRETGVGDQLLTSFIQNILAVTQTAEGKQWTLALEHPHKPVVKLRRYPDDGIDWTVDNGAPGVTPSLSRDYTTEVNVEYGQGSDADCYWENRKFPNLHSDTAPLYPLTLPAVFNPGDGQTGFDAFADELRDNGYDMDSGNTYSTADVDTVEDFQDDAGILVDGIVGPQTWAAAFQPGSHQGDLHGVWVKPLAEDKTVEPFLFNAQGAIVGDNPRWDNTKLRIEKMTLFGDRVPKHYGRAAAKQMLARDKTPGHVGTITLTSDPAEGSRRDIQAGQNIKLRRYHGENLDFHIARAEWDESAQSMTLTVDTKARDLMTVASVHQRHRDIADPVGHPKTGWRTGLQVSDRVQWACEDGAGKIPFHAQFGGLWTVLRIPAGEFGQIAKINLAAGSGLTRGILNDLLSDPPPDGYHGYAVPGASKLALAVFSREVTANMLANLLGNPLALNSAGNNPWDDNADQLTDWGCQYAAGGPDQAGGFYPHQDPGGGSSTGLTGRFVDAAGWPFESKHRPWLWVGIYTTSTCYVGGRMYPGAPA